MATEFSFTGSTCETKVVSGFRVGLMRWSPRMDLVAVSGTNVVGSSDVHELYLYRWGWQRVWVAAATSNSTAAEVTALEWRPDGQVLVVGDAVGDLRHLALEDGRLLHCEQLQTVMVEESSCSSKASTESIIELQWLQENITEESSVNRELWTQANVYLPDLQELCQG